MPGEGGGSRLRAAGLQGVGSKLTSGTPVSGVTDTETVNEAWSLACCPPPIGTTTGARSVVGYGAGCSWVRAPPAWQEAQTCKQTITRCDRRNEYGAAGHGETPQGSPSPRQPPRTGAGGADGNGDGSSRTQRLDAGGVVGGDETEPAGRGGGRRVPRAGRGVPGSAAQAPRTSQPRSGRARSEAEAAAPDAP